MSKSLGRKTDELPRSFIALQTAVQWCDVSEKTVKRWIGQGLPVYQAGARNKVLIRPADIETFLTKKQVPKSDLDVMVAEVVKELQP